MPDESSRSERLEELLDRYEELRSQGSPPSIDELCKELPELRDEVSKRVAALEQMNQLLEATRSAADSGSAGPPTRKGGAKSRQIGNYRLLQKIGEGGQGAVYAAEQSEPVRRRVAIKLVVAGRDSERIVNRFNAERQALAMMEHQNIAKIYDAGVSDLGEPWFAMELVNGVPITEYCDKRELSIRERLELFIQTCNAIAHAHQKGVMHRDIKPSNVLVTQYDGLPVVKVIDFGLAKALEPALRLADATVFTEFGAIMGTIRYMSPEQAELNALDIDTRSDVYSLGVLLYELLTGTTPIEPEALQAAAVDKVLEMVRESEAPRPSFRLSSTSERAPLICKQRQSDPARLSHFLQGDLDWITLKSLEKARDRRYDGARQLAADVQRFLDDEPIDARPPSTAYRLQKWVRRHRVAAAFVLTTALLLMVGIVGTTWGMFEAMRQGWAAQEASQQAQKEAGRARREQALSLLSSAAELARREFPEGALLLAARGYQVTPDDDRELKRLNRIRARALLNDYPLKLEVADVRRVAVSPQQDRIAVAGMDGSVSVIDLRTGKTRKFPSKHGHQVLSVQFDNTGKRIVSAGADRAAVLWDATSGTRLQSWQHQHMVGKAWFHPTRNAVITLSGQKLWECPVRQGLSEPILLFDNVFRVADVTRDGTRFLCLRDWQGSETVVFDVAQVEVLASVEGMPGSVTAAAFDPTGERFALATSQERNVAMAAPAADRLEVQFRQGPANAAKRPSDGNLPETTKPSGQDPPSMQPPDRFENRDDMESAQPAPRPLFHSTPPTTEMLSRSPIIAQARMYDAASGKAIRTVLDLPFPARDVSFADDSPLAIVCCASNQGENSRVSRGAFLLWNTQSGRREGVVYTDGPCVAASINASANLFAIACREPFRVGGDGRFSSISIWGRHGSSKPVALSRQWWHDFAIDGCILSEHAEGSFCVAFGNDRAARGAKGGARVWDLGTIQQRLSTLPDSQHAASHRSSRPGLSGSIAFDEESRLFAYALFVNPDAVDARNDRTLAEGAEIRSLEILSRMPSSREPQVRFRPQYQAVPESVMEEHLQIDDTGLQMGVMVPRVRLTLHAGRVPELAFAARQPNGNRPNGNSKEEFRQFVEQMRVDQQIRGQTDSVAATDGEFPGQIQLWDVRARKRLGKPLVHDYRVDRVEITDNVKFAATVDGLTARGVMVWDLQYGLPLTDVIYFPAQVADVKVSPNGRYLGVTTAAGVTLVDLLYGDEQSAEEMLNRASQAVFYRLEADASISITRRPNQTSNGEGAAMGLLAPPSEQAPASVAQDTTAPSEATKAKIRELEAKLEQHPERFDHGVHQQLRHLYSGFDEKASYGHIDIILQHNPMDSYMIAVLSSHTDYASEPERLANRLLSIASRYGEYRFVVAAAHIRAAELVSNEQRKVGLLKQVLKLEGEELEPYRTLATKRLNDLEIP